MRQDEIEAAEEAVRALGECAHKLRQIAFHAAGSGRALRDIAARADASAQKLYALATNAPAGNTEKKGNEDEGL